MRDGFPAGWTETTLEKVAIINPPGASTVVPDDQAVTFVPMAAVEALTGRISTAINKRFADVKKGFTRFRDGDVLFAKITPCMENGKIAVARGLLGGVGCGSTEFHVVRPKDGTDADYLRYFLARSAYRHEAQLNMQGAVGQQRVPPEFLRESTIPLAPPSEQRRIVSRIEELFSEIDEGERALERVQKLVERYRQSVLKAAVTGKLTGDWQFDPRQPDTDGSNGRGYALPPGWKWQSLDEISWSTSYGTSAKCTSTEGMVPVLRIPNVRGGRIDLRDLKWAPPDFNLPAEDSLARGDLLVVRTNGSESLIGVGAVVLHALPVLTYFASYLIRFRLQPEPLLAEWINLVWQSDVVRRFVHRHKATSAGQYNVSQSKLRSLQLPIPPENERRALLDGWQLAVSRIEPALRECAEGMDRSAALRQSVLKAAFSGQLVPQDPSDEPASVLLARLAAEQAADSPATPLRRAPRARSKGIAA